VDRVTADVTIAFESGTIVSRPLSASDDDPALVLHEGDGLLMPALFNGHDHGSPMSGLEYGVVDDTLELWLPSLFTGAALDQRLLSLAYFARSARSGIAGSVTLHNFREPQQLVADAVAAASAARQIGVRCAFAVPLHDRQFLAYADPQTEHELLRQCGLGPADLNIMPSRVPTTDEALALVDSIDAAIGCDLVNVQYGPLGPQWASDELLAAVADRSAATGRRVHMHLLETHLQREWADARFGGGLVPHLDELGLLSPRLTVAHGVWLGRDELELLRDRGVTVSVSVSSNIRLRSGIAPYADMLDVGTPVAMGLDGGAFDDDADPWRELRLMFRLNVGHGLDARFTHGQLFHSAIEGGARAVHGGPGPWGLEPGRPADVMILDRRTLSGDVMEPYRDHPNLVVSRATVADVAHLVVAGRHVVKDGVVQGVDEPALVAELRDQFLAATATTVARREPLKALVQVLHNYYATEGHRHHSQPALDPTAGAHARRQR
jgi:cytosine/adenosine deaminase-related metal-dependent hydrolase